MPAPLYENKVPPDNNILIYSDKIVGNGEEVFFKDIIRLEIWSSSRGSPVHHLFFATENSKAYFSIGLDAEKVFLIMREYFPLEKRYTITLGHSIKYQWYNEKGKKVVVQVSPLVIFGKFFIFVLIFMAALTIILNLIY